MFYILTEAVALQLLSRFKFHKDRIYFILYRNLLQALLTKVFDKSACTYALETIF